MTKLIIYITILSFIQIGTLSAGDDWTKKTPSPKPSAKQNHGMAYIGGDKALLYGQNDTKTWVYDLSEDSWTQQFPASNPSYVSYHSMAYIGGDKVLLFGGWNGPLFDKTWVYDLSDNNWTQKFPDPKPSARWKHKMAYIGDDKVLLFGGNDAGGNDDETWVYDLSDNSWTQKSPVSHPTARVQHCMTYMGGDKVLLFGGEAGILNDETWIYDLSDNNWTQKGPASKPSARFQHAMAYLGGDKALLFGGYVSPAANDETWIYDLSDDSWIQDLNTTQPSARYRHDIAETSMDGSSYPVLFGGVDDETWTFGGGDYPLPVELTTFTASIVDGTALLFWETETEVDNYGFDIERCEENDKWKKIGFVEGHGNSNSPKTYSFADNKPFGGCRFQYRLKQIDTDGKFEYSDILEVEIIPNKFVLYQNYPNPFNPSTTMRYSLPQSSGVQIIVFNTIGEVIKQELFENQEAGNYEWTFTGNDLPSGVYFCRLQAGNFVETKKMVLMK